MTQASILVMPDFNKAFVLVVDASGTGIGVILSQEGKPIAYLSKAIGQWQLALSTYEKEVLAILMAVHKWKHYLSLQPFTIKKDHELEIFAGTKYFQPNATERYDEAHGV